MLLMIHLVLFFAKFILFQKRDKEYERSSLLLQLKIVYDLGDCTMDKLPIKGCSIITQSKSNHQSMTDFTAEKNRRVPKGSYQGNLWDAPAHTSFHKNEVIQVV